MSATITLRQVQADPTRNDIFGLLDKYLRPESTMTGLQAAVLFAQGVDGPDEAFFWGFWNNIFDVAQQIPHDNPAQDKLVTFLRELTLVPDTGNTVWEVRVWTDLPLLGAAIREHLSKPAETYESVSFHAFVARLLHAGLSPGSEITAIWILREALEQNVEPAVDSDSDRDLMKAAVYIEYAGATLVQTLALRPEPHLDEALRRSLRGGERWGRGVAGLTVDRWNFWGTRFRELGGNAGKLEARDLTQHAARLIEMWSGTRLSAESHHTRRCSRGMLADRSERIET
ncbi:hypothetical protein GGR50DRAFT_691095 [Xylaria sp. CBS 124048]|nr:hypothetical protein GGR50DRAFT_691095 [Xylaria sp. CBS 124048]